MYMIIPTQDDQVYDLTKKCAEEFGKQAYPLRILVVNRHSVGTGIGGAGVVLDIVGVNDTATWEDLKSFLTEDDEICFLPSVEFEIGFKARTSGYDSFEDIMSAAGRRERRRALLYLSLKKNEELRELGEELKAYWEEKWGTEEDFDMDGESA